VQFVEVSLKHLDIEVTGFTTNDGALIHQQECYVSLYALDTATADKVWSCLNI